jgi:hypothetical protein
MYTLLACADLYGEKMNLEITFSAMPTIGELHRKIVEVFSAEAASCRPQGYPAIDFQIARLQIYDDVLLKWADLVTGTQLHEYDQMYVFQPQSPWHIDVQKDLPPPRPPRSTAARAPPAAPPTPAVYDTPHGARQDQSSYSHQPQQHHHSGYGAASPATPHGMSHIQSGTPHGAAHATGASGQRRSPMEDRLEQNRSREEQLRAELARISQENEALARDAERERHEREQREAAQQDEQLRARQAEIARQRELLQKMEEDFRREQQHGGR